MKELEAFAAVIFTRSVEGEVDEEGWRAEGLEKEKEKGEDREGGDTGDGGGGAEGILQGAWERVVGR